MHGIFWKEQWRGGRKKDHPSIIEIVEKSYKKGHKYIHLYMI
jgi:hypothetical protein